MIKCLIAALLITAYLTKPIVFDVEKAPEFDQPIIDLRSDYRGEGSLENLGQLIEKQIKKHTRK